MSHGRSGLDIVVIGLSLSSSWGNGHATTYRALLKALAARGHAITFLEREQPWYAANRDLENPGWCRLAHYGSLAGLQAWSKTIAAADAVIVGSYVPEGIAVGTYVQRIAQGVTAFYDIDTPVTLAALERGDCAYLSPDQIPGYDLYFSFTGGPTLDLIEQRYGSPAARALYCSADTEIYRPLEARKIWDLSYLGTYSADRQPVLEKLLIEPARQLPRKRFVVAGPQYPDSIRWPANVERIEHVGPADHPAFYAASRWTLNVTRADMVKAGWSPSVRLFEAAACATPIISDRWEGIDAIFENKRSIMLASTTRDVVRILERTDAQPIGDAAHRVIAAGHSARHRAGELETHLRLALSANGRGEIARAAGGAS
jgi:spore maturation protein CgeB